MRFVGTRHCRACLIHFNIDINVSNESQRREESDCSQHQEENITGDRSVAKEL